MSREAEPQPHTWCGLERELHHTEVSSLKSGVSGQSVTASGLKCGGRMSDITCCVSWGNAALPHRGSS